MAGRLLLRRLAVGAVLVGLVAAGAACSGEDREDTAAFCAAVSTAPSLDSVLRGFTDQEPVSLERNLDAAQQAYARVADTAPPEIEEQTTRLVEIVDVVIDAVREHPDDRSTVISDITAALEEHEDIADDASVVADRAQELCDLDLNAGLVEVTTTTIEPGPPTTARG